ncbi:response regulator [Paenibacillus sp. 22594]|uniref:response regulator n=1 Tax=Paenibacillus sp. 22594 TaxID=3453947 RepID=UPI003F844F2F
MINVLIVEDDPMVAEMNKFYVEQVESFRCAAWARSADEAMAKLEEQPFELILLDIYMKESNGLELLSAIRRDSRRIDVIVISAASDKDSIRDALQNGAVDYLIKPFEFERLRAALSAYKEQFFLFRSQDSLDQSELDKLTGYRKEKNVTAQELSKGFTRNTLRAIWRAVETCNTASFSTEEIAAVSGISRVSVGKYLAGLVDMGALDCDVTYGTVGRPVQRYRISPRGSSVISKFI